MEANSTPTAPAPMMIRGFWDFRKFKNRAVGGDDLVIGLDAGQRFGFGTADHQNAAGFNDGTLAVFSTLIFPGPSYLPQPCTHSTLFFFEEKLDAFGVLGDDLGLAGKNIGPVDFQAADFETEFGCVFEMIIDIGVVKKNLGGNTANMEAGATEEGVFLHNDGFQAELTGTNGGYIPPWTASNNRNVIFRHA